MQRQQRHSFILEGYMQRGQFITVEGIEGVGKSTNVRFIAEYLMKKDIPLVATREPGGTPLAELLRETLLTPRHEQVSALTELLVMFAARAQHIQQVIEPALASGKWVISDRFTDATYAYQGGGRGVDMQQIATLEKMVQGSLVPNLTLLLDAPVEVSLQRAHKRSAADRFEQETQQFFTRVAQAYRARAKEFHERFVIIDTNQALSAVQADIVCVLEDLIKRV